MTGPALGPAPRSDNIDDVAHRLGQLPLFMRELPAGEIDDAGAAMQVEALKSLLYDEADAEERAQNFKTQANENFKARKYKEALAFYTQGIGESSDDIKVETHRTLLCNRAACHLELGNYRSCLKDCAQVLELASASVGTEDAALHQNTTLKALFRSAKALLALDRLQQAQDALQKYREVGGQSDAGVQALAKRINDKLQYASKIRLERDERSRRLRESDDSLHQAVTASGVWLPAKWSPAASRAASPNDVKAPHFDPEAMDPSSSDGVSLSSPAAWRAPQPDLPLIFPTFLLRPLANPPTRDLILSFRQDVTFGAQLDAFNANQGAAQGRQLIDESTYAVTKKGRILKVGRGLSLAKAIKSAYQHDESGDHDGLPLVEGWCLEFYIVPKGKELDWVKEMKQRLNR